MKKNFTFATCLAIAVSFSQAGYAQEGNPSGEFSWEGYIDMYYAVYSDTSASDAYQQFSTVSPRSNAFSLNIAQVSFNYSSDDVRASATLHYGDIPSSSWSSTFNFLQQAHVGYRISNNLWVDAGLFTTHIGTEALLPKDNKLSTLTLGTYHEPYFQSGIRLSYDPSNKVSLALHLLNGYNNFLDNNRNKSLGMLVKLTPSERIFVSYSNLFGQEASGGSNRFYNNLVVGFSGSKLSATLGGDWGIEDNFSMYSALATIQYAWNDRLSTTIRGERFHDKGGFLSGLFQRADDPLLFSGLVASGLTLGLELRPTEISYVRFETRRLWAQDTIRIFFDNERSTNIRTDIVITTGIWF